MPSRGFSLPYPVIVLPGMTGSYLRDDYELPPRVLWSLLHRDYARVAPHPDDPRYEAAEPQQLRPDQLVEVAYEEFLRELRYNLRRTESEAVPVFPFGYDWRQPLASTEERLGAFIDEVIDRTKLLRHYDRAGYAAAPQVNLVGHSMGGLIIAGYLARAGASSRVHKVATVATPFRGSFEAVLKVATGRANLGHPDSNSRERDAARLTPALYHLVPSFAGALELPPELRGRSLFDPACWQPTVLETLADTIRQVGLNRKRPAAQAAELLAALLRDARAHRRRLERLDLRACGLAAADWLCIAGVDERTRVRLKIELRGGRPEFVLAGEGRRNEWGRKDAHLTGDGTVPFEGAVPAFLERKHVVCVCPDDFGYWEVGDILLSRAGGFHGLLPNMDLVQRLVVRHFTGGGDRYGNTWGWRAPGVERPEWPFTMEVKQAVGA